MKMQETVLCSLTNHPNNRRQGTVLCLQLKQLNNQLKGGGFAAALP